MPRKSLSLTEKIFRISQEAAKVERKGVNEQDGYNYARIEDVLDVVSGLLVKHRLILTGELVGDAVGHHPTAKGCIRDVIIAWTLEDVHSGESRTWRIPGSGWDEEDKGTYKSLTGSRKYAITFIFNLRFGDEPEARQVDPEQAQARADALAQQKIDALEKRKATIAAKEIVSVTWPEEHNGHKALFRGKTNIMEHHALNAMNRAGKWVEREQGWLVLREDVAITWNELLIKGCNVEGDLPLVLGGPVTK